jgi:phosphopantothenoylcysteine decarboxylase/phosphopantothenate--cysteine ligase
MSLPEVLFWHELRKKPDGAQFRRQHPAGPYVLDFFCATANLAIEVDGEAHSRGDRPSRDVKRDEWLRLQGIHVLRIAAIEVLQNLEGVLQSISVELGARDTPPPPPSAVPLPRSSAASEDLNGKHVIVTAGPTHEPIDPVRVIANRSSGRQGFAIAATAAQAGARVTLIAGPVSLPSPEGVQRIDVETAEQMADAVWSALPADVAVLVAAVADWRVEPSLTKLKKGSGPPVLQFLPTRDILAELAQSPSRPRLLVGFAAETDAVAANASAKREAKKTDWIVANDVSGPKETNVMGGLRNRVHLVTASGVEDWPEMSKEDVARRLVERIAQELQ